MPATIHRHLLAAALCASFAAQAQSLPPGAIVLTRGTTLATSPHPLAGPVEHDETTPFAFATGTGYVSGRLLHRVVRALDGTLDFYWRISVDAGSTGRVNRLTVMGFNADPSGELIANYRLDSPGAAPSDWAQRSADGGTITFTLHNGVGAGQMSRLLMLDTKEPRWGRVGKLVLQGIGGGASALQATLVPVR